MHPTIRKTLICLLLLLAFLAIKNVNSPISKAIVQSINQAVNVQYNYQTVWQEVRPLAASLFTQGSWDSLVKTAKIRLTPRQPLEKEEPVFLDLEGQ